MSYATVRIESLTGNPGDVSITDVKTGERIRPVTHVDFHVEANKLPKVTLTLEDAQFLFVGKPEIRAKLHDVAMEMWLAAQEGQQTPAPTQLMDWAVRIGKEVAAAVNLGWDPDA